MAHRNITTYISKISFGIFFVHIFVVRMLAGIVTLPRVNRILVFLMYEFISVAGSIAIIYIFSKIPLFKRYLFLIKD